MLFLSAPVLKGLTVQQALGSLRIEYEVAHAGYANGVLCSCGILQNLLDRVRMREEELLCEQNASRKLRGDVSTECNCECCDFYLLFSDGRSPSANGEGSNEIQSRSAVKQAKGAVGDFD